MITSFADPETERIWNGQPSRTLPPDIQQTARRKLRQLDAATQLDDLASPRGNRLEKLKGFTDPRYSIRINDSGGSHSAGRTETHSMSGSRTIIADEERLDNVHPGDVLREDFLIGSEIPLAEVAADTGIAHDRLAAIVAATLDVDADADLRLGRYFGTSEGFFLRLQNSYDLEEAWRAHGAELDRIVPRAA